MPSKDPVVIKRAQKRYRDSVKGHAKRKVDKAAWDKSAKGKIHKAASDQKWRQTPEYKAKQAAKARIRKAKRKEWLRSIKSSLSCADCGYDKHPAALQFHHTRDKVANVTWLVCNTNRPLEAIRAEMAKCIVLCACCHAILHDAEHHQ